MEMSLKCNKTITIIPSHQQMAVKLITDVNFSFVEFPEMKISRYTYLVSNI